MKLSGQRMREKDTMLHKEARGSLKGLEISALDGSEVGEALDVVARGMRDNPLHLAAYGEDPERRLRKIHRFVSAAFERTIAWILRNRRMSRDYELLAQSTEALVYVAMIRLMLRRLAKGVS